MTLIRDFLTNGILPQSKVQARKIEARAIRYVIIGEKLYKRGYFLPLLLCVTLEQGLEALQEIHEGICGDRTVAQSMTTKVVWQGYFWPTMDINARRLAKCCRPCQLFGGPTLQSSPWITSQSGLR